MTAQTNITVFDGAGTPVSHTLVPDGVFREGNKMVAKWKESLSSVPDYAQIRVTLTRELLPSGIYKETTRTEIPVMETITNQNAQGYTAPPKVAYIDTLETVGYFSQRGTVTGRRLARQLHVNLLGNVSTSVAASSSGFVPELVDQLIFPS